MIQAQQKTQVGGADDLKWLELVVQDIKSLRYSVVEIAIHDA